MGHVWRLLAARAPAADADGWRRLLELFVFSARGSGFRPALRGAVAEADALLPEIARHAAALAALLARLAELETSHALDLPPTDLLSLLDEAGRGGDDLDRALDLEGALPDVLRALADATDDARTLPGMPHEGYATTRKSGVVPEWVRYVDATHRLYYAAHLPLGWQHLADAELAAVGSAVLDLDVLREHVAKYRTSSPADLDDCPHVIVLPPRNDSP